MDKFFHDVFNNHKSNTFYAIASVIVTAINILCWFEVTTKAYLINVENEIATTIFIFIMPLIHVFLTMIVLFFIYFIYKQKSYDKKYARAEKFLKEKFSDEYKRVNIVLKHGTPYIYSVTFHAVKLYAKYEGMMLHIRVCDEKGNILNEESTNCFVEFLETVYPMALKKK